MFQISNGKVLAGPTAIMVRGNSSYDRVNPNRATAMSPGSSMGSSTHHRVCRLVAPRSRAASSYSLLKRLRTANMISSPNGRVQVRWAPSAEVYQPVGTSKNWNMRPIPRLISSPGMIKLAIAM